MPRRIEVDLRNSESMNAFHFKDYSTKLDHDKMKAATLSTEDRNKKVDFTRSQNSNSNDSLDSAKTIAFFHLNRVPTWRLQRSVPLKRLLKNSTCSISKSNLSLLPQQYFKQSQAVKIVAVASASSVSIHNTNSQDCVNDQLDIELLEQRENGTYESMKKKSPIIQKMYEIQATWRYCIRGDGDGSLLIRQLLNSQGFEEMNANKANSKEWHLMWIEDNLHQQSNTYLLGAMLRSTYPHQLLNRWPGLESACSLTNVWTQSQLLAKRSSNDDKSFSCVLPAFHLPKDRTALIANVEALHEAERRQPNSPLKPSVWRIHRRNKASWRESFDILNSLEGESEYCIVSRCFQAINQFVQYVLVTNWDPLRAYVSVQGRVIIIKRCASQEWKECDAVELMDNDEEQCAWDLVLKELMPDAKRRSRLQALFHDRIIRALLAMEPQMHETLMNQVVRGAMSSAKRIMHHSIDLSSTVHHQTGRAFQIIAFHFELDEHFNPFIVRIDPSPDISNCKSKKAFDRTAQLFVDALNIAGVGRSIESENDMEKSLLSQHCPSKWFYGRDAQSSSVLRLLGLIVQATAREIRRARNGQFSRVLFPTKHWKTYGYFFRESVRPLNQLLSHHLFPMHRYNAPQGGDLNGVELTRFDLKRIDVTQQRRLSKSRSKKSKHFNRTLPHLHQVMMVKHHAEIVDTR